MESTITSVRRRLFTRRAAPWLAWLGLFTGVGWGVHHFGPTADGAAAKPTEVDSAAKAQIKQLFASSPDAAASRESSIPPTPASPSLEGRYGESDYSPPPLPPMSKPADATPAQSVEAETPRNAVDVADDRYRLAAAPALPPEAAPTAVDEQRDTPKEEIAPESRESSAPADSSDVASSVPAESPVREEPDIARGQGPPGGNPLRQANDEASEAIAPSGQDQAAFDESFAAPEVVQVGAAPRTVDERSAALSTARPLREAAARYGNESSPPISSGADPARRVPTLAEPPTPAFGGEGRPLPQQATAPAYDIPHPAGGGSAGPNYSAPNYAAPTYNDPSQNAPSQNAPSQSVADGSQAGRTQSILAAPRAGITPTPGLSGTVGAGRPGEKLLEGPQSPAITLQKLAPPEIQVGKRCTFAIRVKNIGQRAAQQVVVRDEVPMGTQLVGTAPHASVSGAQVQWDLGTLSIGEERIVEMELNPTEEGDLGSVALVTFSAEASAKARCTKPELRLQLTSKPRVMVGDQHLVQIEISNPGSGNTTNVMLLESLPAGMSHEAGPALEFEIGTLRPGETRKLDLVLTAEQAGVIENTMTARADANLQSTASCQFEVIAPGLALSVDGPKRKYLERPATFVVNVDNPGTASAKDVQLVAQLPKGLQYVNANNMGEYDQATHSVYWSLAELPANERGTVELTALPIAPGEHTIRAATKAQQGLEDRAERALQVEGMAALSFETRVLENLIEIGGETTCEIRVTNRGSKAASNVQVAAMMPAGLRAVTAKGDTQHSLQGNQVSFSPLLQLAPGAEAIYQVAAQGVAPGDQRVKVRVTSDDEQPITKEASARVYADQ